MSLITNIRLLLLRIKWRPVIAFILILLVAYKLFDVMPTGYTFGGDIALWAQVEPGSIKAGETAAINVELKNTNSEKEMNVFVEAKTYDENVLFDDSYGQSFRSPGIRIGPDEIRRISFKISTKKNTLEGKYRIDILSKQVVAKDDDSGAKAEVFLNIEND